MWRLPLLVFLVHSTALVTSMLRGLSSAEAALKSSANAETIDVRRMLCGVCCVVERDSKFQRTVFTMKRPELLVTTKSGYRGVPAGCRGPLNYVSFGFRRRSWNRISRDVANVLFTGASRQWVCHWRGYFFVRTMPKPRIQHRRIEWMLLCVQTTKSSKTSSYTPHL